MEAVIAEATRLHKAGVPVDQAIKQANWGEYSVVDAGHVAGADRDPKGVRRVERAVLKVRRRHEPLTKPDV